MSSTAEQGLSDEKLAELAEMREALEADTDADETGDGADDETQPEDDEQEATQEPQEPPSDVQMEQIGKSLDQEAARHTKAVAKIMGDGMGDLVTCPLCITPGFVTVQPPVDFDPAQRDAVMAAMGEGSDGGMKQYPDFVRCETCNGHGHVLSGALNEANYAPSCPDCLTKGYYSVKERNAQTQAMTDATQVYTQPQSAVGATLVQPIANGTPPRPEPWLDYSVNPPEWRI